jgi:DNA mismatch repair protein MutL
MSKIRILSDALASQVAAGEVVERPAAVIRELVENSLDAGASHIEVHVQRGGAALIKIIDDGVGMDREDAMLCLERHATSKIRTKEDLAAIHTFGFRGEAIPSIASVSRFRLSTKQVDSLTGTEIEVHGGRLINVKDCGAATGTVIEVRNLFFNLPARRKFLRTEATEYAHVEQQFRLHAIANPRVAFTLTRDGETVFHLPATTDLLARVRGLVGGDLAERLLEVERTECRGVTLWGYISGPGFSRSTRQMQLSFLNGRPIESPSITYGLREGYHTALMKGQHPITFLFLEMDPHGFDVNVHPAKKEVRFHDGHSVREAVATSVSSTLAESRALPTGHPSSQSPAAAPSAPEPRTAPWQLQSERPYVPPPTQTLLPIPTPQRPSFNPPSLNHPQVPTQVPTADPSPPPAATDPEAPTAPADSSTAPAPAPSPSATKPAPPDFRIIGVLHRLYVLMESAEGLVLMDQHAAHERVMFEKIRTAMEQDGVPTQRLLIPLTLQLSPKDADLIARNREALHRLGLELEPFGSNTFKLETLPTFLKTDDPMEWLDQVIEELRGMSAGASSLRLGEDMIATTACRHAVKANDTLSMPELEALLTSLFACEMPYCCPHGRPTLIQINHAELERKFGRRAPG